MESCHYYKKQTIHVKCKSISDSLIIDTIYVNLQRGNEINWDELILGESLMDSAIIAYNELGVREIDVFLIFDEISCVLNSEITITTNLLSKIKSLEAYRITI